MPPAIPLATYRLQFTKDFTFDDAAALVPYLQRPRRHPSLCFALSQGAAGQHAWLRHRRSRPAQSGTRRRRGFARLSDALKQHDLGLILDFVPNHMGVGNADNAWWLDVLEWGKESPYALAFDIDWEALPFRHNPGVLLPILGRPYGDALQSGEIVLKYDGETGSFAAWYFDHKLPINPQRYNEIIRTTVAAAGATEEPAGRALLALADDYTQAEIAVLSRCAGTQEAACGNRGRRRRDRARACRLSRRRRSGRRQPAPAAGAAELPRGLLARRLRRHQLPALFRHQRSGRLAGRAADGVSRHSRTGRAPDRRRRAARPAPRSHRRPARPGAICQATEADDPQGARRKAVRPPFYVVVEKILGRRRDDAGICRRRRHHRL